jgi:hypothetical protein
MVSPGRLRARGRVGGSAIALIAWRGVLEGRRRRELVRLGYILIVLHNELSWIPTINNGESTQAIADTSPPDPLKRMFGQFHFRPSLNLKGRTACDVPRTRSYSWCLSCAPYCWWWWWWWCNVLLVEMMARLLA